MSVKRFNESTIKQINKSAIKQFAIFTPMEFSSKLLEKAVNEMAQLPGIGKRTALRLVLHLLKQPEDKTRFLSEALSQMREPVQVAKDRNINLKKVFKGKSDLHNQRTSNSIYRTSKLKLK
jgi:hypothetical protein